MTSPTMILIHGAWGGAWCWRDLGLELDRRGVTWQAVNLPSSRTGVDPSTNLRDDADTVRATVATVEGPVVLVGHSYGGAVVTEVASELTTLQRIIYVAALVPLKDQSPTETSREIRTRTLLDEAIEVDGEYLTLNPTRAIAALYDDCTQEIAQWAISNLTTQTITSFRARRSSDDASSPSLYIRCSKDHAIDPALQEIMAARCDAAITLESGHSPFLSQPSILCDALLA